MPPLREGPLISRVAMQTRAARRAVPVAQAPDDAVAPAADSPGDGLDSDLAGAVARLPAKQRQAVAYHYLAGLPYADVAAILGGSADAARRAAADGIAALRRSYHDTTETTMKGEARERA